MTGRAWHEYEWNPSGQQPPLSYYVLRASLFDLPNGELTLDTKLRLFYGDEDTSTKIKPMSVQALPGGITAHRVATFHEVFEKVYANGTWVDDFLRPVRFNLYHWPEEGLAIVNTSRDVTEAFLRTVRARPRPELSLQRIDVNMSAVQRETPHTNAMSLEHSSESGLPSQIHRMRVSGRELQDATPIVMFMEGGAVNTGIEFSYSMPGWPPLGVAVSADAGVRLARHIGYAMDPEAGLEVQLVTDIWRRLLAKHHSIRPVRRPGRPSGGGKPARPRPVQGQQSINDVLEP